MDSQILTILQKLDKRLSTIENQMVTKDDLKDFATRDDLKDFATKDDLRKMESQFSKFATKDDLKKIEEKMATRTDLSTLKKELIEYTDSWCTDLITSIDRTKADATEMENIKTRVRNLERKVALD